MPLCFDALVFHVFVSVSFVPSCFRALLFSRFRVFHTSRFRVFALLYFVILEFRILRFLVFTFLNFRAVVFSGFRAFEFHVSYFSDSDFFHIPSSVLSIFDLGQPVEILLRATLEIINAGGRPLP